ncbi:recombinase RecT [Paenibacillus sp. FSL W8-1287]|uniref:recombinase RecT n=1 Tax=Paenibacillus sp. FSL W8-1287 TaxID=2954653 RepID=UPI0030CB8041
MAKDYQIQAAPEVNINQLQAIGEFGLPEIMTMKETLGKKLTIPQFNLFMYQMKRMGLDPSLKHAFPIPYGDTIDIRIAYEGYHAKAQESEGYQGVYNQVICENEVDDFEAETDEEGIIVSVKHKIKFPRGKAVGAYSIAKREGKKNVIVLMDASEVQKWVKKNANFWKLDDGSIDPDMFKKHVGIRAIKAQYDIAAVVEESMESMNAASAAPTYEPPTRKDVTPPVEKIETTESVNQDDEAASRMKALKAQVKANYKKLGLTDKEAMGAHMQQYCKVKGDEPTEAELKAYLKIMDMQIQAAEQVEDTLPE